MIEHSILKLFCEDRSLYNKYSKVLDKEFLKNNHRDLYKIVLCLDNYYSRVSSPSCPLSELEAEYLSSYPMTKEVDRVLIQGLLKAILDADIGEGILRYCQEHTNRSMASLIALKAIEVSEGKASLKDIYQLLEKTEGKTLKTEQEFVSDDLEKLYTTDVATHGLRWRLEWLNKSLGSLRKGDFGFIFARPETGKTTFLASEITHFANQTDRPILWCNNEEGGSKVMLRCYQAALGLTDKELYQDLAGNKAKFYEVTHRNIRLYDDAAMTAHSVEAICKEIKPALIIFDQLDKVKGFNSDREDLRLGAIYQWAREIAKTYCPVIGVSQADGSGEGVKFLHMGHVANAKTAKQAEADFILGIGKSNEEGQSVFRFLNITKNKLSGDEDSEPGLRHGQQQVLIQPEIARYKDLW